MPFCSSCGAEVTGPFCGSCGKPMGGVPATAAGPLADNVACALCYLLGVITGVLFLVIEPYSKNREVRFHAFQSIFLHVAMIVIVIGLTIIGGALQFLSLLLIPVWWLLWAGGFVLWVMLMFKTYQGGKIVLPIIGLMAQKQAG